MDITKKLENIPINTLNTTSLQLHRWIVRSLPGLNAHFDDMGLCTLPGSSTRLIIPRLQRRARLLYFVPPLLTSSLSCIWRFPMMFQPGEFSGFHHPTSSLDNPHDQKLSMTLFKIT